MNSTENDSSTLQITELDFIKKSLLIQKSEILNKHQEFKSMQTSSIKAADEVDAVVQNLQDNLNIQLHERDQLSLLLIDKALSKFSLGTYGQCESCEDSIDLRRLKARPLATLCISCMEDNENAGKSLRSPLQ
ncbi:MAG: TraR/DksA family transcriptional regulator [Bdellovibrionota bacterium]